MAIFDDIRKTTTDKVQWLYGDTVTWLPTGSEGVTNTCKVLFNRPTTPEQLAMTEYNPTCYLMEYREGDLPGLKESVDQNIQEFVTIKEVEYVVRRVDSKWDGYLYLAILDLRHP